MAGNGPERPEKKKTRPEVARLSARALGRGKENRGLPRRNKPERIPGQGDGSRQGEGWSGLPKSGGSRRPRGGRAGGDTV